MQSIVKENNSNSILLKKGKSLAKISLANGGSITKLILDKKLIIEDFSTQVPYSNSFASAILFPFSNRVYNGEYSFSNKKYLLNTNSIHNDAIHGLIYNKTFTLIKEHIELNQISVTVGYTETEQNNGFPFLYSIYLTYRLSEDSLNLDITVKNEDSDAFPFTIGWHPYFYTEELSESILEIDVNKEIVHNEKMIPIKIDESTIPNRFKIGQRKFDNCYTLKNNSLNFLTPDYALTLHSSFDKNYVQVYTPELENHIAIEPITGPSNSFNNQLGLQVLESNTAFSIQWTIQLQDEKL